MNGSGNRKRAFSMGFSSGFVLEDIKTIVAGSFPRLIHTKVLRVVFLSVWHFVRLRNVTL